MLKSSPLFTTIGLSLTIPMAALGGMANDPSSLHLQNVVGGLLVLVRGPNLTAAEFCRNCMGRKCICLVYTFLQHRWKQRRACSWRWMNRCLLYTSDAADE